MRQSQALVALREWDKKGRHVFQRGALAKLFPRENAKTFTEGLNRLIKAGLLVRAGRGVYVNP